MATAPDRLRPALQELIARVRDKDRRLKPFLRRNRAALIPELGTFYVDRTTLMLIVEEAKLTNQRGRDLTPETACGTWKGVLAEAGQIPERARELKAQAKRAEAKRKKGPKLSRHERDFDAQAPPTDAAQPRSTAANDRPFTAPTGERDDQGLQKWNQLREKQDKTSRARPPVLKRKRM